MPTHLTTKANEESTFGVTATFTDEDGNAVTPNAGLVWSLFDYAGAVVNEREDVALTPDTSVDIVLSGDDLQISSGHGERTLVVEGTYDSATWGNDLPLKDSVTFSIEDLKGVT